MSKVFTSAIAGVTLLGCLAAGALHVSSAHAQQYTGWSYYLPPVESLWSYGNGLVSPSGVALDDEGYLYVANSGNSSITVYGPDWELGSTKPIRTLRGASTLLANPSAVAFDASGLMYVVNTDSITVYPREWADEDSAPIKYLRGTDTELWGPRGVAFDSLGRMYVANSLARENIFRGGVTVYSEDWPSGNTRPISRLSGAGSGVMQPTGIAFDPQGNLYLANAYGVTVYSTGWIEDEVQPDRILTGPASGLDRPSGIAIADDGTMYVTNVGGGLVGYPHVAVFAPGWASGDTQPSGIIFGASTHPLTPLGIALDDRGRLFLANAASQSIAVYQPQTITFDDIPDVSWTTKTVNLTAQSDSGLPVGVSIVTPLNCEGSGASPIEVNIKSVGTCTFIAEQAGSPEWLPATPVTGSFSITSASQVVSISAQSDVMLNQKWVRLTATTTSGLPVVWTSSTPQVCKPRKGFGARVSLINAGTCELTATQPGNRLWNYASSSVSFEVTP